MSPLVGTQLNGRYRLDAQIGMGGMSTVYRAFDATLERRVAVKLMHREIATDSDQLERFRREARAVAQLSHPHVVGVTDAGEDDGRPFIVLEYVEGETLKDRIRRSGRLDVEESIAYAIEIGRALEAAHARGIVHRDIKPQNVLIDEEGSAKVTDFGIARSLHEEGLTADGRVLGTTDYVSPEQALGHDVNGQTDIYSLGVVLFEMLTGDVPFHGENQVAVAMKHVREDIPDVAMLLPEISASLAAVLDRMTAKDLAVRYPDAASAVYDLEDALAIEAARSGHATGEATAVLRTLPASARRRIPLRMRWRVPALGLVLVLAVIAVAIALLLNEAANRAEPGTGKTGGLKAPTGQKETSVAKTSAHDYDPLGTGGEHADDTDDAVDRDPGTAWSTEEYTSGALQKDGVGIYVDARPELAATGLVVRSKPGWTAEIYAAPAGSPPADIEGWDRLAGGVVSKQSHRFPLNTRGEAYRYYLVWITKLPPGERRVEIAEISLLEKS